MASSAEAVTLSAPLRYTPLGLEKPQIRLFKLAHSRREKPWDAILWEKPDPLLPEDLFGEALEVFDLETAPPFAALSYEWGDLKTKRTVNLGSTSLEIGDNLYNLLFLLNKRAFGSYLYPKIRGDNRYGDWVEYIWADQICINQQDVSEKSRQVLLMSDIYSQARHVIAWPGHKIGPTDINRHHSYRYTDPKSFLHSRYWQRLWIVQELYLAKDIIFIGRDENMGKMLSWYKICGWLRGIQRQKKNFDEELPAYTPSALKAIIAYQDGGNSKILLDLFDAIRQFSESRCSDPRDKVFGLLGMVKTEQRVNVDYTMTTAEVFHATIKTVLDTQTLGNPQQYLLVFSLLAKAMGLGEVEEEIMHTTIAARVPVVEVQAVSTTKGTRRNSIK